MVCVRSRVKRGLYLILACYAAFLVFSVHSYFGGTSATGSENGAQTPSKGHHAFVVNNDLGNSLGPGEVLEDGYGPEGAERSHPNSVLLPKDLDLAIQQQPEGRAVRKKLSQPQPQQINVVVEDAPPGTFGKTQRPDIPEDDAGFKDLDVDDSANDQPFEDADNEEKTENENSVNDKEAQISVLTGREGNNKEGNMVSLGEHTNQDLVLKKNRHLWIAPDGSPDDLNAEADAQRNRGQPLPHATTPNPFTPAPPRTAVTLNVSVSNVAANFREIADVSIYSAFFDDRTVTPHVQMIAVGPISRRPTTSDLWCVFSGRQSVEPVRVLFHQTVDCKRMKKYCFYMLSCQVPPGADFSPTKSDNSVVVVLGKRENNFLNQSGERVRLDVITNKRRPTNQINKDSDTYPIFSVCVPPLYGKLNVLQFVEFVELNRLFGAVHFTFYKFRVSREIARVLTYYEDSGVARVLPWNLPAPNDVWYKGQSVAMGDCLYRNMHLFDFVAFQDLDEFFVPTTHYSWGEMFEDIYTQSENVDTIAAVYQLYPVLFYTAPSLKWLTNQNSPHGMPDFNAFNSEAAKFITLKSILRSNGTSSNSTKMFVKPERVLELDLHAMVKPVSDSYVAYKVDPSLGTVHHYRHLTCEQAVTAVTHSQNCGNLFQNKTVWKFGDDLIWSTKKVLQELNRLGTSFT